MESNEDIENKLMQIQRWFFDNRKVLTEHQITVIYAFSQKKQHRMSAFTGGKVSDLAAFITSIVIDMMEEMESEDDLRQLFNLIAGRICRKFEELVGSDDEDE